MTILTLTAALKKSAKLLEADRSKVRPILAKVRSGAALTDEEVAMAYWFYFNAYQVAGSLDASFRLFRNEALREFERLEGFAVARGLIKR